MNIRHLGRIGAAITVTLSAVVTTTAPTADASSVHNARLRYCADRTFGWWYGTNLSKLHLRRVCIDAGNNASVNAMTYPASKVTYIYVGRYASGADVDRLMIHELAHEVDYWTTPAMRRQLYTNIGWRTDGMYYHIPSYTGSINTWYDVYRWGHTPRETLANAVQYCSTGVHMNDTWYAPDVPMKGCRTLIRDYHNAVARAH